MEPWTKITNDKNKRQLQNKARLIICLFGDMRIYSKHWTTFPCYIKVYPSFRENKYCVKEHTFENNKVSYSQQKSFSRSLIASSTIISDFFSAEMSSVPFRWRQPFVAIHALPLNSFVYSLLVKDGLYRIINDFEENIIFTCNNYGTFNFHLHCVTVKRIVKLLLCR